MNPEIISFLETVSYRLFRGRVPVSASFKQIYQKSRFPTPYEVYIALMPLASLIVFVSTLAVSAVIFHIFLDLTLLQYFIVLISFSFAVSMLVPIIFITYPILRREQRRKQIDSNLIYTTGYMSVLSAGGVSIERIFERVAQVEQCSAIKDLAKRFVADTKMFGMDVTSAIGDVMLRSPSEVFSRLLVGTVNTVKTSGDLKSLLEFETKSLLTAKREQLKRTVGTLSTLGEIYITAMVVGPVVFILMLTILSIMGNAASGLSPVMQMNLLVFFGLPAAATIFIIILGGIVPEE